MGFSVADAVRLLVGPESLTEVRVLLQSADDRICRNQYYLGAQAEDVARDVHPLDQLSNCIGIYLIPNPIDTKLIDRNTKWRKPFITKIPSSNQSNMLSRRWILVDCDSIRPGECSATEAERVAAFDLAENVIASLSVFGFGNPIKADSGNGCHLIYPVEMPPDQPTSQLIKEFLGQLTNRCKVTGAKVDPVTWDSQRMVRLYGTKSRKGESTPDRPHRLSGIIDPGTPDSAGTNTKAFHAALEAWREQDKLLQGEGNRDPVEAARRYVSRIEGAVSGAGGHNKTYRVASLLVEGFGLTDDQAFGVLQGWNASCKPEWSERDLRHKIESAKANADQSKIGHLLVKNQPSAAKQSIPDGVQKTDATVADLIRLGQSLQWLWPGWIQRGVLVGIAAEPGAGKCFAKGTKILMFDGSVKNVENIVPGDEVMGPDSLPRRVERLGCGMEMMYKISHIKGGVSYIVNESHILSVKMSRAKGYYHHEVVNLTVKDYLSRSKTFKARAKGWSVGVDWPEVQLRVDPYILGLWIGDGTSKGTSFWNPDNEVIQSIKKYCLDNGLKFSVTTKNGKCPRINVSGECKGNALLNGLRSYGLCPKKFIPKDFLINSRENRLHFLAGILDTDGHMCNQGFEFSQKDKSIADSVCFVARSLGFGVSMTLESKKCQTGAVGKYWRIFISGDCSVIPTRIKRKIAGKRKQIKDVSVCGLTVEPVGFGEYYGFELSGPDRLFLLDSFTVVHNTRFCADIARRVNHALPWPDGTAPTLDRGAKVMWLCCDGQWGEITQFPQQFGIPPEAIYLNSWNLDPTDGTVLDEAKQFKELEERINRTGVSLVFVDTVMNSTTHNTTRPEEGVKYFKPLAEVAQKTNTTIILVTHLSAGGEALGRRIVGQCRQMISLEKIEGEPHNSPKRKIYVSKSNSVIPPELTATMGNSGNEYAGEALREEVRKADPNAWLVAYLKSGKKPMDLILIDSKLHGIDGAAFDDAILYKSVTDQSPYKWTRLIRSD